MVLICTYQFDGFTFVAWCSLICLFILQIKKDSRKPPKQCMQGPKQGESEEFSGLLSPDHEFSASCKLLILLISPFLRLLHVCVNTIFYDNNFLIHNSMLCKQDVKYKI